MVAPSRAAVHQGCLDDPQKALEAAFAITTRSLVSEVEQVFVDCAARTGISSVTAINDAHAFIATGAVSGYVLQCCSAKLASKVNA